MYVTPYYSSSLIDCLGYGQQHDLLDSFYFSAFLGGFRRLRIGAFAHFIVGFVWSRAGFSPLGASWHLVGS